MHAVCAYYCPLSAPSVLPDPWPAPAQSTTHGFAAGYKARTSTAAQDPGTGNVAWNNAAQSSASQIFISTHTTGGTDVSQLWQGIVAGQQLTVQLKADNEIYSRYTINSVTDNGTWFAIGVTPGSSAGLPFTNNSDVIIGVSAAPIA